MRIWSADGTTLLAAAWGQDPNGAPGGQPSLDMGTTVLQIPAIIVDKYSQLGRDENSNGFLEPGDSIIYTVTIQNTGTGPTNHCRPHDDLAPGITYVAGSITCTGCQIPPVDDGSGTPFPAGWRWL